MTAVECTREIMGKNFFGIEETSQHFGVSPTRSQITTLLQVPFTETLLQETKHNHILVAVFPLSFLDIRKRVNFKLFRNQSWYNNESFANERGGRAKWHLVRKIPFPEAALKKQKRQLLLVGNKIPTCQVMVYTIIGHYLATGEMLFEHKDVRTSSVDSNGNRVRVGYFSSGNLNKKIQALKTPSKLFLKVIDTFTPRFSKKF